MNSQRLLIIIALLLGILILVNFFFSREKMLAYNDNDKPNKATEIIYRVKNQNERAKLQAYIDEYQKGQTIIKSIVGPSGDTIDFVDIYTQPAIKKHKIAKEQLLLGPSTFPQIENESQQHESFKDYKKGNMLYEITGDTCPQGAIPIQRLTMKTLARFETLEDFFKKGHGYIHPPCGGDGGSAGGHEYANAARNDIPNWGAESVISLWSPYVEKSDEFSLSQMWVVRGSGEDKETLEAGWQVYEDLYGDWRAHLFIYFTPDNYGSGGGYNLSTGDFVQVNNTVYIGGGFTVYSDKNGSQYYIKLMIYKDGARGDWWLRYGDTWVGYWPRSVFDSKGLNEQASRINFGGEIVNIRTDNRHTRTDMGSGSWPYQGYGYSSYHRNIKYVDVKNFYRNATGLTANATNNNCYDINLVESTGSWGVYFYFGGSGYNSLCKN